MSIDRELWRGTLTQDEGPTWPCHRCKKGLLAPVREAFIVVETADSTNDRGQDTWEPEWIRERFTCLLKCNWSGCGETAVAAGHSVSVADPNVYEGGAYNRYRPEFIRPAPDMFSVPADCPENVRSEVHEAFSLFWTDHPACANRIRTTIESVLTFLGVPTTTPGGGYMSAHARIIHYQGMNPANAPLADLMLAVKWLGNAGSHTGSVKEKDIFDGFDLLEYVLHTLFPPHTPAALAQSINVAKGPVP
jgi:hypothetical protein